jgi:hypothetical protein
VLAREVAAQGHINVHAQRHLVRSGSLHKVALRTTYGLKGFHGESLSG